MDRRTFVSAAATAAASVLLPRGAYAQPVPKVQNGVLIHGLFADGSCWSEVISRLQAKGIHATAAESTDVVAGGGRGYAGCVGMAAGTDGAGGAFVRRHGPHRGGVDPRVSALVYVAARAPDV